MVHDTSEKTLIDVVDVAVYLAVLHRVDQNDLLAIQILGRKASAPASPSAPSTQVERKAGINRPPVESGRSQLFGSIATAICTRTTATPNW
jgi:hypothetical protein